MELLTLFLIKYLIMSHVEHLVNISNLESDAKYNYRFVVEYEDKIYPSDVNFF